MRPSTSPSPSSEDPIPRLRAFEYISGHMRGVPRGRRCCRERARSAPTGAGTAKRADPGTRHPLLDPPPTRNKKALSEPHLSCFGVKSPGGKVKYYAREVVEGTVHSDDQGPEPPQSWYVPTPNARTKTSTLRPTSAALVFVLALVACTRKGQTCVPGIARPMETTKPRAVARADFCSRTLAHTSGPASAATRPLRARP